MNRSELLRLMPRDGRDEAGAARIVELGHPAVAPVLPDIVRWLRVAESPVADAFARFLAGLGEAAVDAVAWGGLHPENCWARHRILREVLPHWPDAALKSIAFMLTTTATQPDAYDNDLVAIELLAARRLAEPAWLTEWVGFKEERWAVRAHLLGRARAAAERTRDARE